MDLTRVVTQLAPPVALFPPSGQPLDLISIADLKLELDITETGDDAYLAKLITRASRAAQTYCNRTFVPATWQERVFPARDHYPWQLPPRMSRLQLSQFPLAATPSPAGTAPPQAPTLSHVAGGSLSATTYFARASYVTPAGETALSLEASLACPASTLLQIAAPGIDTLDVATGWNVYLSTASFAETKQNATPPGVNSSWTLPTSGLVAGAAPPAYVTIVEAAQIEPTPLAEGVDFLVDAAVQSGAPERQGAITRLWYVDGTPKSWSLPVTVIYPAGYSVIPDDLQEAVILLAKMRWYARTRDPAIRSQNSPNIYEASYVMGTGPGGPGDMSADAAEKLDRYRHPVVA